MESNESSASFDLNDFKNKMKSLKKSINELLQREKESDKGTDKELIQSLRNYVDARKKSNRRNNSNLVKNKSPNRGHVENAISYNDIVRKYNYDYDVYVSQIEAKSGSYLKEMAKQIVKDQIGIDESQELGLKQFAAISGSKADLFCEVCKEGPLTEITLKSHKAIHGNFEETCCSETFKSYWSHYRHVKKYHGFKCNHCDQVFPKLHKLKRHLENVGPKTMNACTICKREFNDKGNLRRHIRQVHTDLKPYKCDKCDRRFGDAGNLKRHIKGKHEGLRDQCNQCNQSVFIGCMQRHIRTYHSIQTYNCSHCDKDFRTRYGLSSHVNEKHKSIPTKYPCEICGKDELYSPQAKTAHKRSEHPGIKLKNSNVNRPQSYECSFCDVIFYNRKERDLHHKIVHHEDTRGLFKCEACNTTAITKSRLEYHIENYCQKTYNKL